MCRFSLHSLVWLKATLLPSPRMAVPQDPQRTRSILDVAIEMAVLPLSC